MLRGQPSPSGGLEISALPITSAVLYPTPSCRASCSADTKYCCRQTRDLLCNTHAPTLAPRLLRHSSLDQPVFSSSVQLRCDSQQEDLSELPEYTGFKILYSHYTVLVRIFFFLSRGTFIKTFQSTADFKILGGGAPQISLFIVDIPLISRHPVNVC